MSINFDEVYNQLNLEQKQAADTIEGPLMIIAGAGTGKTQVISTRIGKILKDTQVSPESILCLTFTEAGVSAMRSRLISFLDALAYRINVHTYHSFANDIILDSPEDFGIKQGSKNIEEIEQLRILQSIISSLPSTSPLKVWGDPSLYEKPIISAIRSLKQENITPGNFSTLLSDIKTYLAQSNQFLSALQSFSARKDTENLLRQIWQNHCKNVTTTLPLHQFLSHQLELTSLGENLGTTKDPWIGLKNVFKDTLLSFQKQLPKLQDLSTVFSLYETQLTQTGRYDYEDMIRFVGTRLITDTNFRQSLQEKYQYILVDEYQDTSASQNTIIYGLCRSNLNAPNICVVGDDDQSIYRFQGANMQNMLDFLSFIRQNFGSIPIITLQRNYRSHQTILDAAADSISQNESRISRYEPNIQKILIASKRKDSKPVKLFPHNSQVEEYNNLATEITSLLKNGTPPKEIAVLVRKNDQAKNISDVFKSHHIPHLLSHGENLLEQNLITNLLDLFLILTNNSHPTSLFRFLYSDLSQVPAKAVFKFIYKYQYSSPEKVFFNTKLSSRSLESIKKTIFHLTKFAQSHSPYFTLVETIRLLSLKDYIEQSPDKFFMYHYLHSFSEYLKKMSSSGATFDTIITDLDFMRQNDLPLTTVLPAEYVDTCVNILTVHKAKGLEYEHVFIPDCSHKFWSDSNSRNTQLLPPGLLPLSSQTVLDISKTEDERRLFYVALTRAKGDIYISYSTSRPDGKDQVVCRYVSEINPDRLETIVSPPNYLESVKSNLFPDKTTTLYPDFSEYLKKYLSQNYVLTATDLTSFIQSPQDFYIERILRLPLPPNKHIAYGNAMHNTLAQFYRYKQKNRTIYTLDELKDLYLSLLNSSEFPSPSDYEDAKSRGLVALNYFYPELQKPTNDIKVELNFSKEKIIIDSVPIKGRIDRLEFNRDTSTILDYKTGSLSGKISTDPSNFGSYYIQLMFYKLLSDNSTKFSLPPARTGILQSLRLDPETNTFERKEFVYNPDHLAALKQIMQTVYQKIINLDFSY